MVGRVGPYAVEREVGRGAMGAVFKARSPSGDLVAIKVLRSTAKDAVARFERERRLLSELGREQGFVPLLDSGLDPALGPWFAMPYLDGTLRGRLVRGALRVSEVVLLARALASAIANAHEKGVVHRDLKPENVLFSGEEALVADLGIAKHFVPAGSLSLSQAGSLRGTIGYMAPEQVQDSKRTSPAVDVFALGAILHECLTGKPLYEGSSVLEILDAMERPAPPLPKSVPSWLAAAIRRALERDPAKRFPDGRAFLEALEPRAAPRSAAPWIAGGVLAALAGAGGVLGLGARGEPPRVAPQNQREELEKRIALARRLLAEGAIPAGLAEATAASELDPRSASAWALRALVAAIRRESNLARELLQKALALDARSGLVHACACCMAFLDGDEPRARDDATRALALDPTLGEPHAILAQLASSDGRPRDALVEADRALELLPASRTAAMTRACAVLSLGRPQEAETILLKLLASSDDRSIYVPLAEASRVLRKRTEARAYVNRALEAEPRDADAQMILAAIALDERQAGDEVREIATRVRASFPQHPMACYVEARYLIRESDGAAAALALLETAIEKVPGFADAFVARAHAHELLGNRGAAMADVDEAVKLLPTDADVRNERAKLRLVAGDLDGALRDTDEVVRFGKADARIYSTRATIFVEKGDPQRALEAGERILALGSQDPSVLQPAAIARARAGDHAGAVALDDQIIADFPDYEPAYIMRAVSLENMGKKREAIAAYQAIVDRFPERPSATKAKERIALLEGR